MNESHPPRFAEALLESFGAEHQFRDAILGDLAQEYVERSGRFGSRAARMWYWRETLVAMPHLLRKSIAAATRADARRMLNVAALCGCQAFISTSGPGRGSSSFRSLPRPA